MQIEEDRIIRLEVILMASSVQKILTNKSVTLGSAIGVGITFFWLKQPVIYYVNLIKM